MTHNNDKIRPEQLLRGMYADGYFPDVLVDRVRDTLLDLCRQIEAEKPASDEQMIALTHAATERINVIAEAFYEHDSEFETVARDETAEAFEQVITAYGFGHLDLEEVIAPRDW